MEIINSFMGLFGVLVASGSWIAFWKVSKRIKTAEAKKAELDNEISLAKEWRETAEAREEKIAEKDEKIDALYIELNGWRDRYNALMEENNKHKIESANMAYRVCNRRNCTQREPQTGF